jgi:hypothetical protein
MRTTDEWTRVQIPERVHLVVGWRVGNNLRAGRLRLHRSMDLEFRREAEAALSSIGSRKPRPYEPTAHLEEDEVFLLTTNELPHHAMRIGGRRRRAWLDGVGSQSSDGTVRAIDDSALEPSALLSVTRYPDRLDELTLAQVRGRRFLFYAVVFTEDRSLAFVKRHNPASVLNSGLTIGLFGQTIRRVGRPALVFEHGFDLIIDDDEVAALAPDAIVRLFADVEVSAAGVPALVGRLRQSSLRIRPASLEVIEAACAARRLLARRLAALLDRPYMTTLTPQDVEYYLKELEEDVERYVNNGEVVATQDTVGDLLDVLGQLHYRGGYDDELWRADRSSRVSPGTN